MHPIRNWLVAAAGVALLSSGVAQAAGNRYQIDRLVSDIAGLASHTDSHLVNPWGIAFNPNGFVWVANNESATSTLYDGQGNPSAMLPVVNVPGKPTGIVFNGSNDFQIVPNNPSTAARFLFASQDGSILGWSPNVNVTKAVTVIPSSGAVYTGLALAGNGEGNFLYAADFLHKRIDVFNAKFEPVSMPFRDPAIPPQFSPFNITAIQGDLYVAYAQLGEEAEEVPGQGLGFVDVFDADGNLIRRVATRGQLNAPWGIALAPATFGRFANRLLVGNFGNGRINAYDAHTGELKGTLRGTDNKPLEIEGLWGLAFGNGILDQPTGTLFFAAGIEDETHGLYGSIKPAPTGPGNDDDD